MDERKKTRKRDSRDILKWGLLLLIVLLLFYQFLPLEYGNSKGALKRNIVRELCIFPWEISVETVEDFTFQDGQEMMRAVVYEEDGRYVLQWYRLNKNGDYEIYWKGGSQYSRLECRGVHNFPDLKINGYQKAYDLYYVTLPEIKEMQLQYDYHLQFEGEKDFLQTNTISVPVEETPQLFCIPDPWDMEFAPKLPKDTVRIVRVSVSAYDGEGKLLYETIDS